MIRYTQGDILKAEAEALVNTVNCVGVMGRGIALQFKEAYPANFRAYVAACKNGQMQPGRMLIFPTGQITLPRYIINFPTKRHWRGKSRIEDIEEGLTALVAEIRSRDIRSIAIPPLGSGLGGLNWADVRSRIERAFSALPEVEAIVYEPGGVPGDSRVNPSTDVPKMTPGRAALISIMDRYLAGLLDPFINLLEVHKLMYFLQTAGEPLKLQYVKATYGPYAENLRHVLRKIDGHLITGYAEGGEAPDKPLELVPGALRDAEAFLQDYPDTHERITRVTRLVDGFETPSGLELLATVHWVVTQEGAKDLTDITHHIHSWNQRKQQFTPRQISIAVQRLRSLGWF